MNDFVDMTNGDWKTDIVGQVNNTDLPPYKALMPVFEAIANSIHATARLSGTESKIEIFLERMPATTDLFSEKSTPKITNIKIVDNGQGFNDDNLVSFKTINSRKKESIGGKGLGRFTWLKAFEKVEINSIYSQNNICSVREFEFSLLTPQASTKVLEKAIDNKTTIKLINCKKKYQNKLPTKASTFAQKVLEHHISSLLQKNPPKITVEDSSNDELFVINDILNAMMVSSYEKTIDLINDQTLNIKIVRLSADDLEHTISICAHDREVLSQPLHKYIPNLKSKSLKTTDNIDYKIYCIVSGDYLDQRVNSLRTGINFDEVAENEDVSDMFDESASFIYKKVVAAISEDIKGDLEIIEQEKQKAIESFITNEEPEYRVLLKHAKDEIASLPAGLPNNKLDIELYKIKQKLELNIRESSREIFDSKNDPKSNPKYQEKFNVFLEKMQDLRQSELTKYVLHRRTMLDLLNEALRVKDDGKYALEDELHTILYPTRETSDDIEFGHQNLWIIDERLAYHYHIASDIELNKNKNLNSNSADRPDILFFDQPNAFAEESDCQQSIVIIELKRPERDDYNSGSEKKDNPIAQIYSYIREIKKGKANDKNGARIRVPSHARFYCYIVADLTESLVEAAEAYSMKKTPDGLGYFGVNENHNAYMEIIGFHKMLGDARKRNAVLFEKLGLQNIHK